MAMRGESRLPLPELESMRRLREAGVKGMKWGAHLDKISNTNGMEKEKTGKNGTIRLGNAGTDHKIDLHPDGSWEHKNEVGETIKSGKGAGSLMKHARTGNFGYDEQDE